jgi:hypothetical protein
MTTIHNTTLPAIEPALAFGGVVIAPIGAAGAPAGALCNIVRHLSQPKRWACGCHVPGDQHVGQNGTATLGGGPLVATGAVGLISWRQ